MRRTDREIKQPEEIEAVLREATVCHLALIDRGKPYALALNYGWEKNASGWKLYFHCAASGRKLDIIRENGAAAFVIDIPGELQRGEKGCDWGMRFRSVAGEGIVHIVNDPGEKKLALEVLMEHYSGRRGFEYDEPVLAATVVLCLRVSELTGKQK